jgi:hypothetical protein
MKTVKINLYQFNELSEEAKQKAVFDHSIFLNEIDADGCTFNDVETIEAIEVNEYLFFADGELAHCTTYTGKHGKAGKTELNLHGEVFDITTNHQ